MNVARITVFRPDGQQTYDKVEVNSIDNGVINFSIEARTEQYVRRVFATNLPFMVEHEE
jgi:hypothetical protein